MEKVINGKRYNTSTAILVYKWRNGRPSNDFGWCQESLYRKRTGEYFLFGEGGPFTEYAEETWAGTAYGEKIIPLSKTSAKKWAEEYMNADEFEKEFMINEEEIKKWILEKSKYFSMREICQKANINYQIYYNYINSPDKRYLSLDKLIKIKETMQEVAE